MARWRRGGSEPEVYRISGARTSLTEDVRARQRRYTIAMLVRTASVLLTVALWDVSRPLAVVTLALGTLLPYVAVIVANAGRENAAPLPRTTLGPPPRAALPAAGDVGIGQAGTGGPGGAAGGERPGTGGRETATDGR
ncbi:DUF3099 domain-containing protein [Streptomyces bohaiensis]|uniref:DUF3099 domain-containing protein n=1 Tax=Streptomyces bohaiensis TaxID=1431344 RepID=A0ABX1CHX8_9ACTN|nr:DUF3099 domain-containing protein [Streptomyces bohaiensis]NJQ17052.1 DUF3099 domain-containing protein [Streptomyces bohaiensis]